MVFSIKVMSFILKGKDLNIPSAIEISSAL